MNTTQSTRWLTISDDVFRLPEQWVAAMSHSAEAILAVRERASQEHREQVVS